jgi:molybdenum cofactor cytidylyltransferase
MIWAVVLAAGESKRMGRPKQLLPYGSKTILETVLENVLSSPVDRTLVVLGAAAELISPHLARYPVDVVLNADYRSGMLSSVQCGIRALPPAARAALIFLGDQPELTPATAGRVIAEHRRTGRGLVRPFHAGRGGHPLLVDLKYREEIGLLSGGIGLRELLARHADDAARIEVADPGATLDIDTPADYDARIKTDFGMK